jgi:hypothetical protein
MLDSLDPKPKINFQASDRAKVMSELATSREALESDPEKICELIQLALSFFSENDRVVSLKIESSGFLYNALSTALHILFTPRDLLPGSTKDLLKRIIDQIEAVPPYSLAFSSRDIKEIRRILKAGRWTFRQFMEVGALLILPCLGT